MSKIERRAFVSELRAGESQKVGGLAVPFNSLSEDLGGWREMFQRGAFTETLADGSRDVWLLWAHDLTKPLASRLSGTLMLAEDAAGLRFDATLNQTSYAGDAYVAIRAKTVSTVSIGFSVPEGGDTWQNTNGMPTRIVKRATLYEISPTAMAAYSATDVGVRTLAEILAGRCDPETVARDLLREAIELERSY